MCLAINSSRNRRDNVRKGRRTYFKVLAYNSEQLAMRTPYRGAGVKVGINISDRKNLAISDDERLYGSIRHGIHVYINRKEAKSICSNTSKWFVVPVTVYMKNLVSFGYDAQAVFTKVSYKKKDLDEATKLARTQHERSLQLAKEALNNYRAGYQWGHSQTW